MTTNDDNKPPPDSIPPRFFNLVVSNLPSLTLTSTPRPPPPLDGQQNPAHHTNTRRNDTYLFLPSSSQISLNGYILLVVLKHVDYLLKKTKGFAKHVAHSFLKYQSYICIYSSILVNYYNILNPPPHLW